jgi:hypothetical protein
MKAKGRSPSKPLGPRPTDLGSVAAMDEQPHERDLKRSCHACGKRRRVIDAAPDPPQRGHRHGHHGVDGRGSPRGQALLAETVSEEFGHGMPSTPLDPQQPSVERFAIRTEPHHRVKWQLLPTALGTPPR